MKNGISDKYKRTHENLKKEALRLFLEKGYDASSVREITQKTNLSVGAFYRHFDSKEAVFVEIWDEYTGSSIERTIKEVEKIPSPQEAVSYLLEACEAFSNDEITNKLYVIFASLGDSNKLDKFPHINQSSKNYRRMLCQLVEQCCPDFSEEEKITAANAVHCLVNTYSMRNADSFQAFYFEKDAFRRCIFTLLHG